MINCLVKISNNSFQNRINYVLRFISQHPLLKKKIIFTNKEDLEFDITLSYGKQQADSFFIPAQDLIFSNTFSSYKTLFANQYDFESMLLYCVSPLKNARTEKFFLSSAFQFDILETIFFHISRMEEWFYEDKKLDDWDMMKADQQFLVRHKIQQIPVVDQLIYAFGKAIGIISNPLKSCIRVTHDIDEINHSPTILKSLRSSAGIIWRRQNWKSIFRIWRSHLNKQKNEYDTFDWMLSSNAKIEKCIYFLVGGATKYDTPYNLNTQKIQAIFQMCKTNNYKIGIHPSYDCWRDQKMLKTEKEKLEKLINVPIKISRQHYLHFDFKTTPQILDQQKIKEDSTLGFNDRIGFRCGTGFGYHLYDFKNEKPFNFIETPLIFMDSALLMETNYNLEKTDQLWHSFLEKNKFHTKITFNFHNTRFYDASIHGIPLKEWYQKLLK